MLSKLAMSHLIDRIEECAFNYKQYGIEVQLALYHIRDLWRGGYSSMDTPLTFDAFQVLLDGQAKVTSEPGFATVTLNVPFCYELEGELSDFFAEQHLSISSIDGLQAAITRYDEITHPRAYALLEALAKQSDLTYPKRGREEKMRKLAEYARQGFPLPEALKDIEGFDADRFKHLAGLVPKGQSILDFYILNQIRHMLSRHAPEVIEAVRERGIPRNVYFGSLELSTPGAQVMPVEGADEYLVILSRALWSATSLATGIITRCVELEDGLPAPVNFNKKAATEFQDALTMLDRILRCEPLEFEFPPHSDEQHKQFWELLDSATKQFIFGHEYAHVLLGHIGSYHQSPKRGSEWNQELMADITAINLMLCDIEGVSEEIKQMAYSAVPSEDYLRGISAASEEISGVMRFHIASGIALVLYLFWRMDALNGERSSLSSSHPPTTFRLGCMWAFFKMNFDQFYKIFEISNLMLRDFMSLLSPLEGSWRDRFQECAFEPLLMHSPEVVAELLDQVNTQTTPEDPMLAKHKRRLEELFHEAGAEYEEKYSVLEECAEMVRRYQQEDPLRSIREALRERSISDI